MTRCAYRVVSLILALVSLVANSQTEQALPSSQTQNFFQQGLLLLEQNRPDAALEAFAGAEQQMPNDPRIQNFRGIALTSLGRISEAASAYRRAIELDPKMVSAYRNLGFLEWTAHQTDNARLHLGQALALDSNDNFSRYYLGRIEVEVHRYDKAVEHFKQLATSAGNDTSWAQLDLSLAYLYAGNFQDSIRVAKNVSEWTQTPSAQLASAYSIVGIANARLGKPEQSIAALRLAAEIAPEREENWLNLTRQLMDVNRFAEAVEAAQDGLKSSPKSYALHLRLGAAYFSSGRYNDAEKSFRELVAAGDPLPTSYVGLAQVLLHTGRAAEAAAELSAAEEKLGPQFLLIYFRGLALNRAGNREASLREFERAVQINPNSAEAHLGVGKTSLALGRPSDAVRELRKVIDLDPNNLPARRLLGQAYRRLGDQENAMKFATSAADIEPEPRPDIVGDFLVPDWQDQSAR